jgi:uncharacterized SAM-binding protein YcdF (DUF218 family)
VPILRSLGVANTILVTSRVHMRRAVGTFRAQGMPVIPAPAPDRHVQVPWPMGFFPTEAGLAATASGAHEIAGLAYYGLRGWYKGAP